MIDEVVNKKNCTGCSACYNKCPNESIEMIWNSEGFLEPKILDSCVQCGICRNVCPSLHPLEENESKPIVYAAYIRDQEILKNSSSGGIFTTIAKRILSDGGVVCGAVYTDEHFVKLETIRQESEISRLQGSKYVESIPGTIYREIEDILPYQKVLFCGLPCQVAALKLFLQNNIYRENLYTIDLVCHGAPAAKLYQDYLFFLEKKATSRIVSINHRAKVKKWSPMLSSYYLLSYDNGEKEIDWYAKDPYLKSYAKNLCHNQVCYHCSFAKLPRQGDITLGDYYGLGVVYPFQDDCQNGVNQVLINSQKGQWLIEQVKDNIIYYERPLKEALMFNVTLSKPANKPVNRDKFYIDYESLGIEYVVKKYMTNSKIDTFFIWMKKVVRSILGDRFLLKIQLVLSRRRNKKEIFGD